VFFYFILVDILLKFVTITIDLMRPIKLRRKAMEDILTRFLKGHHFNEGEIGVIADFFAKRKFSFEGRIYLATLLAHAKSQTGIWQDIWLILRFLSLSIWEFTRPMEQRANPSLQSSDDNASCREKRFLRDICLAMDISPMNLPEMKELWGDKFTELPKAIQITKILPVYKKS